jgi:hypothetical protein
MDKISNKFSLSSARFDSSIVLCLCLIWLAVVGSTVSSILAQPFNLRQRIFWVTFVVAVPLVGVLAYLPFSFRREDMPHIFLPKGKKGRRRHGNTQVEVS